MTRRRLPTPAQIRAMPVTSVRDLCDALEAAGLIVEPGGSHLRVVTARGVRVGTLPHTPSDHRTLRNCRSDMAHRIAAIRQRRPGDRKRTPDLPTGSR